MKYINVHFTSYNQKWKTPKKVYEHLDSIYHFDFDPCPSNPNFDGLEEEWGSMNYVNPPYNAIKDWLKKGVEEQQKGRSSMFLIPSRTDTKWFHEIIIPNYEEIFFIKGRLKFTDQKNSAPFPSMLVYFKGLNQKEDE